MTMEAPEAVMMENLVALVMVALAMVALAMMAVLVPVVLVVELVQGDQLNNFRKMM
jgi:hypothetical protein